MRKKVVVDIYLFIQRGIAPWDESSNFREGSLGQQQNKKSTICKIAK